MQKLQALRDHLVAAKVARPEQINGVMESGTPQARFELAGPDLLMFEHTYVGRIVLEKTPHDIGHLLGCIFAWMQENADEDDEVLSWVGQPVDDRLGDLDVRIQFTEEAHYVPKPNGYTKRDVVRWKGHDYVPGATEAASATDVEVTGETE